MFNFKSLLLVGSCGLLSWVSGVDMEKFKTPDGTYKFQSLGKVFNVIGDKKFDIKPQEMVTVSFKARVLSKDRRAYGSIHAGFRQFDAQNRRIYSIYYHVLKNSETVMTRAANKGERVIYLKDNPVWQPKAIAGGFRVALNYKPNYADFPDMSLDWTRNITAMTRENGALKITLKAPLTQTYAVGTKVRLHNWSGENSQFSCWPLAGNSFRKYSFVLSNVAAPGPTLPAKQFLAGAKTAQFAMSLSSLKKFPDAIIEIKDIEVKHIANSASDLL